MRIEEVREMKAMIDPEIEFKEELQVFGNEVDEAMQCFYAEQTIHNVARDNPNVHRALNRNAAFWKIASRALQAKALIVLGRIFDRDSRGAGEAQATPRWGTHSEVHAYRLYSKETRL